LKPSAFVYPCRGRSGEGDRVNEWVRAKLLKKTKEGEGTVFEARGEKGTIQ